MTMRSVETSVMEDGVAGMRMGDLGDVPSKIEVARRDGGLGQILTSGPIIAK